jgi:hypothetical protein
MKILSIIILFNTTLICFSQKTGIDKTVQDNLLKELNFKIDSFFESDFLLNNGRHYIPGFPKAKGHPYFNENKSVSGTLIIGSKLYKGIQLIYNLNQNFVICYIKTGENEELPIRLNNEVVTGFTIDNHVFVNNNTVNGLPPNGFYEIVYENDNIKCYAKWTKKYLKIYTRDYMGEFDSQYRTLYLIVNGVTKEIQSKIGFLNSFGERKKKVKIFMKRNKMRFSQMSNPEFCKVFQFAEQLTN